MEGKLWLPVEVLTVTSKWPGMVETTCTFTGSSDVVSVWSVMIRSYLSPPKRREERDAHGDEVPALEGLVWSRRATKRAA